MVCYPFWTLWCLFCNLDHYLALRPVMVEIAKQAPSLVIAAYSAVGAMQGFVSK